MVIHKFTIWAVGLFFLISLNGLSTVMCYGADGHMQIETAFHSHCECPKDEISGAGNETGSYLNQSHDHCQDIPANLVTTITKARNRLGINPGDFCMVCHCEPHNYSLFSRGYLFSQNPPLQSHFSSLCTIILLV